MVLTQDEIDGCRDAFLAFDKDRSGTIDVWELRQVLEAMGQKPTEEELFQMISEVDDNMSGSIDFGEFLKVIENQKERAENFDDESDMSKLSLDSPLVPCHACSAGGYCGPAFVIAPSWRAHTSTPYPSLRPTPSKFRTPMCN